ncbi:MAG: TIGR03986 family CRISPR-associated RAMP protein, partial [Chloroflexi bacterium]
MTIRIEPAPQAHKNPGSTRTASAPYNFVPLPEVVVTAVSSPNDLPSHNTYADEKFKHTGYFDVTLTTRSPLYVRAALTLEQFGNQERGDEPKDDFRALAKNTPDFFYTRKKEAPVIPGSSLRGMLRALLEIVSYGKMTRVSDK